MRADINKKYQVRPSRRALFLVHHPPLPAYYSAEVVAGGGRISLLRRAADTLIFGDPDRFGRQHHFQEFGGSSLPWMLSRERFFRGSVA